jgi:hypothetical protein
LKCNFSKEAKLPRSEGGVLSGVITVKDEVVSFFPDLPGPDDEYFHEETRVKRLPCLFHHGIELKLKIKPLVDAQVLPTPCTKGAIEE